VFLIFQSFLSLCRLPAFIFDSRRAHEKSIIAYVISIIGRRYTLDVTNNPINIHKTGHDNDTSLMGPVVHFFPSSVKHGKSKPNKIHFQKEIESTKTSLTPALSYFSPEPFFFVLLLFLEIDFAGTSRNQANRLSHRAISTRIVTVLHLKRDTANCRRHQF